MVKQKKFEALLLSIIALTETNTTKEVKSQKTTRENKQGISEKR